MTNFGVGRIHKIVQGLVYGDKIRGKDFLPGYSFRTIGWAILRRSLTTGIAVQRVVYNLDGAGLQITYYRDENIIETELVHTPKLLVDEQFSSMTIKELVSLGIRMECPKGLNSDYLGSHFPYRCGVLSSMLRHLRNARERYERGNHGIFTDIEEHGDKVVLCTTEAELAREIQKIPVFEICKGVRKCEFSSPYHPDKVSKLSEGLSELNRGEIVEVDGTASKIQIKINSPDRIRTDVFRSRA